MSSSISSIFLGLLKDSIYIILLPPCNGRYTHICLKSHSIDRPKNHSDESNLIKIQDDDDMEINVCHSQYFLQDKMKWDKETLVNFEKLRILVSTKAKNLGLVEQWNIGTILKMNWMTKIKRREP